MDAPCQAVANCRACGSYRNEPMPHPINRLTVAPLRRLPPTLQGIGWMVLSGLWFGVLNALLRIITQHVPPVETQFLRYLSGALVMLPFVLRAGFRAYSPNGLMGQLWRGAAHTSGMLLWFTALPHLTLADTTAIGFTGPIFVMLGGVLLFHERMVWARWVSAAIGFCGVMIVVAPNLSTHSGTYQLVMLGSAPLFAVSQLITKALTRRDRTEVIVVWQCLTISLFSLPLALWQWHTPTLGQCGLFLLSGVLGSAGHYCATQAYRVADLSATQPVRFLDLVWSVTMGFLVWGDLPTSTTLLGGLVIFLATSWVAQREARGRKRAASAVPAYMPIQPR
jgi:drug/metabolite transporter (DMT)-like permease